MMRRFWLALPVVVLALFGTPPGAAAATDGSAPRSVVEGFHGALLHIMKNADSLGVRGRYNYLKQPAADALDLTNMIRVASGSFWRKAGEDDRQRLVDAFSRFSIATYASQFDGYSGQRFQTVGNRPGPQQTVLVATRIVDTDGDGADLTYVMKDRDGRWLIADILLDNVISQLAVRRSEYHMVLRKNGIGGLSSILNDKADALLLAPD
jgi:phospholipid transport system substrate-binding protein